ncbi:hypothetical protein [Streptomyces sp. MJP52]|uniref:trypsin-like serine peptidase n=1 Tax=Streptomyces sp. MJP52 TaxID=2940555 RepID=UPI00247569D6|nr:hypothetical protein [Streptomyces sp. MJP52]MDH6224591.1 V8-like Glu-specific endopeptidase [Streptomyces sp. MJP52]
MRPIRPPFPSGREDTAGRTARTRRGAFRPFAAVALASALALTAGACGPEGTEAADKPPVSLPDDGKIKIPQELTDKLKEHGIDLDEWRGGAWKNWDKDDWLREADQFINPVIEDLWNPDRMRGAEEPDSTVDENAIADDQGVTDPTPAPVEAAGVSAPYSDSAPAAGKLFFDGPQGTMVCSATVVKDPANPGKSNLVWTAGHCVHAGEKGGWYRNIAFVPSYNDQGMSGQELAGAAPEQIAPHGLWWAQVAMTSDQWIAQGGQTGGDGAPFDYAVLKVTPENGGGKSLEETVGAALPVEFDAPAVAEIDSVTATGYPAAKPFDGERMFQCEDRPGRLSVVASDPTMYRIGCTMTAGSSGGGWVAEGSDGKPALVSNTSIGPVSAGWLAGPRLDAQAEKLYESVSAQ